jgi:hypothetical protein
MDDATESALEGARALRAFLLEAGRALGPDGVDRLRATVLGMAGQDELKPAARHWSAAMGAALQMIMEPDADLPALADAVDRHYRLGLDAWFVAQAAALEAAQQGPALDLISLRAGGPKKRSHDLELDQLAELCRAGSAATRGSGSRAALLEAAAKVAQAHRKGAEQ